MTDYQSKFVPHILQWWFSNLAPTHYELCLVQNFIEFIIQRWPLCERAHWAWEWLEISCATQTPYNRFQKRISFSFSKYGVWHQQGVYRLCVTQNWVKFPMERAGTANSTNQTCALLEHEYHSGRETGGSQRKDGEGLKIKSIVDGFATWSTAVNAGTEKVERRKLMAHSSKGL